MGVNVAKRIVEQATGELPSPTGIALTILQLAQRDDTSVKDIARVTKSDPALSGRLLKFVNSPHVGLSRPVVSVETAVSMLGIRVVRQLALGISVLANSRSGPCKNFDYALFWSESLATAFAAKLLCEKNKITHPDEAFVLGLLCQIGILGLANIYPDQYSAIYPSVSQSNIKQRLAKEQQVLGIEHIELTLALLQDWGLPELFLDAVQQFKTVDSEPSVDDSCSTKLARVIKFSSLIGKVCVSASEDEDVQAKKAALLIEKSSQFDLSTDEIESLFVNVGQLWKEWGSLMEVPAVDVPSFSELIELASKYDSSSRHKAGLRVLVIDDDPLLVKILKQQLESNGHYVITATSGHEGLQVALEAKPQLIITDWIMPDMDGITLCRSLREARFGQLLYIIMLTVHDDEAHLVKAFEAGADDYLSKPINENELIARICAGDRVIKLQHEVDRERQHNHLYLDTVEVAIVALDASGKITLVNRNGCELLGYKERELLGENWFELFVPDHLVRKSQKTFSKLMNGEIELAKYCTKTLVKCANNEKTMSWHYSFFYDAEGDIDGLLCAGEDITERIHSEKEKRLLEKQLQQSQKMESIGQLTGGLAHDFNNILASIMGYTNLAQERFSKDNAKLADYLNEVYQAGERARDLVAQMLAFSRGGISEPQALALLPLVKQAIKMLQSTIPSSIELKIDFAENLPKVMMDPVQLHQIVMNLCINARDAMQGSGRLGIRLQLVKRQKTICTSCHCEIEGDFVELQVNDTGKGIKPENRERIFDPFFSTKEIGKGTGMGLSIVHGIVHKHGGHIELQSEPQMRTTFSMLFPAIHKIDPDIERSLKARTSKHILVVDDEQSVVNFLKEIIEIRQYRVTVMTDSKKALALFTQNPDAFDVVITDHMMPNLTGTDLSKAILNIRPDISVILCTGRRSQMDKSSLQKLAIKRVIDKPINVNLLFETIAIVLGE